MHRMRQRYQNIGELRTKSSRTLDNAARAWRAPITPLMFTRTQHAKVLCVMNGRDKFEIQDQFCRYASFLSNLLSTSTFIPFGTQLRFISRTEYFTKMISSQNTNLPFPYRLTVVVRSSVCPFSGMCSCGCHRWTRSRSRMKHRCQSPALFIACFFYLQTVNNNICSNDTQFSSSCYRWRYKYYTIEFLNEFGFFVSLLRYSLVD